jgi:hypothetical protein
VEILLFIVVLVMLIVAELGLSHRKARKSGPEIVTESRKSDERAERGADQARRDAYAEHDSKFRK